MTETGKPLVTVVILTYNQERFVGQAIESAVGQVCDFPFEVLVVDDCSTDGTAEVCRRYAERYPQTVKFVRNEKNKGLIDNYFDTLLSVETPYIADCAGDDYWCDPHKLQRQVDILEHNSEVVLVHTNFCCYSESEKKILPGFGAEKKSINATYDDSIGDLMNQEGVPFVFVGTACFRTLAFRLAYFKNEYYFRNKDYLCEDFQLVFFLLREGVFLYEEKVTAVYRLGESISHSKEELKTLNFLYKTFLLRTDLMLDFKIGPENCPIFMREHLRAILSLSICLKRNEYAKAAVARAQHLGYKFPYRLKLYVLFSKCNMLASVFRFLKRIKNRKAGLYVV